MQLSEGVKSRVIFHSPIGDRPMKPSDSDRLCSSSRRYSSCCIHSPPAERTAPRLSSCRALARREETLEVRGGWWTSCVRLVFGLRRL